MTLGMALNVTSTIEVERGIKMGTAKNDGKYAVNDTYESRRSKSQTRQEIGKHEFVDTCRESKPPLCFLSDLENKGVHWNNGPLSFPPAEHNQRVDTVNQAQFSPLSATHVERQIWC